MCYFIINLGSDWLLYSGWCYVVDWPTSPRSGLSMKLIEQHFILQLHENWSNKVFNVLKSQAPKHDCPWKTHTGLQVLWIVPWLRDPKQHGLTVQISSINLLGGWTVRLGLEILSWGGCSAISSSLPVDGDVSFLRGRMFSQLSSWVSLSWISVCGIQHKMETFLVTLDLSPRWAVTMVPCLSVTTSGVGLNGLDSFFSRDCFTRIVSPWSLAGCDITGDSME